MRAASLVVVATAVVSSSCGGSDSGGYGGNTVLCVAVETDENAPQGQFEGDAYSTTIQRSSVRTAGPDEQLAPPADFCSGPPVNSMVTNDLIDENGRHVWFAYGAEQFGEIVDVPPLPTLTNASLAVDSWWGWGSYTHVELSEDGQLLLALHDGELSGAEGLDVVAEGVELPKLYSCGTETLQRLRFNDEVSVDNAASAAIGIGGASYTVTNLWSISYDNWNCTDVPDGAQAAWMAWRD